MITGYHRRVILAGCGLGVSWVLEQNVKCPG
jgi:hypothetical protein